jgi:hypothetical protein
VTPRRLGSFRLPGEAFDTLALPRRARRASIAGELFGDRRSELRANLVDGGAGDLQ